MLKSVVLAAVLAAAISGIAADYKVVCYYSSWAVYHGGNGKFGVGDINRYLCTHIIYAFAGVDQYGNVNVLDSWRDLPSGLNGYHDFTGYTWAGPGTKPMISIGGWSQSSWQFSQLAANPGTRSAFVQNVLNFLQQYNFAGLDLDWEYPNQRGGQGYDVQNFVELLKELRQAFNAHGYILSVAVGAAQSSASQSYNVWEVSQYVDFINLMTYDFNGVWNSYTAPNAPLYGWGEGSVDAAVRYWLSQGAPGEKVVVGIPAYGNSYTLANAGNNGVGAPTSGAGIAGPYTQTAGTLGYNEICEVLNQGGWTVVSQSGDGYTYAYNGNKWIVYDDYQSAANKANYVKYMRLGGAMVWSVDMDDFHGVSGMQNPILTAVNNVFHQ